MCNSVRARTCMCMHVCVHESSRCCVQLVVCSFVCLLAMSPVSCGAHAILRPAAFFLGGGSKRGSQLKYCTRPNWLWVHQKGPLGDPGPHLSSPILPWFCPEHRKSLFWPSGAGHPPPLWAKKNSAKKMCLSPTSDGDGWGCLRGPEDCRGHGPSRACGSSLCATQDLLVMPPSTAACWLQTEQSHTEGQEFRPSTIPELTAPMDLPSWGPVGGP